jgi:hypothetical protein
VSTCAVEDELALVALERGVASRAAEAALEHVRKRLVGLAALEKSHDLLLTLLGLGAEIPEERPAFAPGGYAHELERIADLLNDRDCAPEPTDPDQSVFAGVKMLSDTLRELILQLSPKAAPEGGAQ